MSDTDLDHLCDLVDTNNNRIIELGEFIEFVQRYAYARTYLACFSHLRPYDMVFDVVCMW